MGLKRPKIAVIGAGGNVGAAVVQWSALKELGDIVSIDVKGSVAQGKGLDLAQCGPFIGFDLPFTTGEDPALLQDSDIVVMTAGIPRKPGQTREELIGVNAKIVKDICLNIKKYAPNATLVVVSNPLDAMVFVAKQVTGFPRNRVIGSAGVLDSSRFRYNIAQAAGASVRDVQAIVLGAHTDKDMVPITSTATIGGVPLHKILKSDQITAIVEKTKKSGADLTALIGTSAWLAPGSSTATMVESLARNQNRVLPCSVELQGEFGFKDTFVGVPTQLNGSGAAKIYEIDLDPKEKEAFKVSVEANKELMKIAGSFL